jgi:predicted RNA polymerase sigma factor
LDRYYAVLKEMKDNPVIDLNRAIILSYTRGPASAVEMLESLRGHPRLSGYHLLHATLGELHARLGNRAEARANFTRARALAPSRTEKDFLQGKIAETSG